MSEDNIEQATQKIDSPPSPPDDKHPRKHVLRNILLAVGLIAATVVVYQWIKQPAGRAHTRPAAAVGVRTAVHADIPVIVTALGTVQPLVTATVRPQLAGVLSKLMFQDGQLVKAGQTLAQIDPRPYRLALAEAKANLARDEAELTVAKLDLKRYETLLSQDSIASQQVDTQRALVRQLTGTVTADRAAIGTAELNLEYTAIKSPIDGRVGIRQVDIGNYLTPSDANGIVVVTQLDPIDISFSLPQIQLSAIGYQAGSGAGLPVKALDQNNNQLLATGHFLAFDNQVDTTTGTVKAKARFDNSDNTLFPGQFVNISLLVTTLQNAVTVPISAVRHGVPGDFVFVVQPDNTVRLTPVITGPSAEGLIAVTSGLEVGAVVVTDGADGLEDGSAVRQMEDDSSDGNKWQRSSFFQTDSMNRHS
ncbi:multidrug resistance protein MdtA [Nitrosomonas stercoris]|uniref:Multidrug resistance protein MdtA n=1 Tax=Nitrosomonas stercoris TaxID=1444684 RepID=A0A4Y1YKL4_9PROT|nr:multidrug resistance protein MdtA [Nitrosomonas stercoris]